MENKKEDFVIEFKIISLGDTGVGKTSIFKRYIENNFDEDTMSTIGMSSVNKKLTLQNGKKICLKLIDTSGQERYRAIPINYYKNANGVLFVFAHNDKDSFDHIKEWIKLFDEYCNNKDIPKFLIGNKNDLKKFDEQENFDGFIKEHNIKRYISTSAKDNINIAEIFKEIAEIIDPKDIKPIKQTARRLSTQKKKNRCC